MPAVARKHYLKGSIIFHAYNRSSSRIPIFREENDFKYFMNLLKRYIDEFYLKIYHWVIMNTHYHILFEQADPKKISSFMAGINRAYTSYHHAAYETSGFLWQGRFGLQPIQKEVYLLACGRYIERNPVRAGIVEAAHEYPYSSARFYCGGIRDGITFEDIMFRRFGREISQRRENYIQFLRDFNTEEEELFRNGKAPVGDEDFKRRLQNIRGRYLPRGRGKPPRGRILTQHAVAEENTDNVFN